MVERVCQRGELKRWNKLENAKQNKGREIAGNGRKTEREGERVKSEQSLKNNRQRVQYQFFLDLTRPNPGVCLVSI